MILPMMEVAQVPRKDTPRLNSAYGWLRGEDWWGDPTSYNRLLYDSLFHPSVISMTATAPPAAAEPGDQYIVAAGAEGIWEGHENYLAMLVESDLDNFEAHLAALVVEGWLLIPPFDGLRVRARDIGQFVYWNAEYEQWLAEPVSAVPDPDEGTRYDIAMSVGYAPEPGETLLVLPIVLPMLLGMGAPGSRATIITPPSQGVQLPIMRNGGQVGTLVFGTSSFDGVFNIAETVQFAPGDRLRVVCPPILPAGLENFGMVLRMTLT